MVVSPVVRPDVELVVAPVDVVRLRRRVVLLPERAAAAGSHRGGRRPYVVASAKAARQAARLLPGRVLEEAVVAAINAKRVRRDDRFGLVVELGGGVVAVTRRDARSPLQTRRAWRVARLVVQEPRPASGGGEGLGGRVRAGRPPGSSLPPPGLPSSASAPARALVDPHDSGGATR
jgi:hypothetical protein